MAQKCEKCCECRVLTRFRNAVSKKKYVNRRTSCPIIHFLSKKTRKHGLSPYICTTADARQIPAATHTVMKKIMLSCFILLFFLRLAAQETRKEPYQFTSIKQIAATPVKSQDRTGTCWAFSSASFLESEMLRTGKSEHNFSEMFVVRHIYRQKCENYVRRQGSTRLGEGGLSHDFFNAVSAHGLAPETVYPGRKNPGKPYNHAQLEKNVINLCDELVRQAKSGNLSERWMSRVDSLLDTEFGPVPEKFTYGGANYTPETYRDWLGIQSGDYLHLTSFTHHPFWSSFVLEIPDNFANGSYYNLPIDDLMRCLNMALQQGYSVEWDADVSNDNFSMENGLAIVPATDPKDKNTAQRGNAFQYWEPERAVGQEYRQQLFDRQITQDDHLMHITGLLDEGHAGIFYAVKNSWGETGPLKGYLNVSEAYMRLNTISFTVHKSALPQDVRRRLGLEAGEVTIEGGAAPVRIEPQPTPAVEPANKNLDQSPYNMRKHKALPKVKARAAEQ